MQSPPLPSQARLLPRPRAGCSPGPRPCSPPVPPLDSCSPCFHCEVTSGLWSRLPVYWKMTRGFCSVLVTVHDRQHRVKSQERGSSPQRSAYGRLYRKQNGQFPSRKNVALELVPKALKDLSLLMPVPKFKDRLQSHQYFNSVRKYKFSQYLTITAKIIQ